MGIENRDYYRESSNYSSFGAGGFSPVCKYLIIANVVVYLLQIFVVREPSLSELQQYAQQRKEIQEFVQRQVEEEGVPADQIDWESHFDQLIPPRRTSVVQEWFQLDTSKVVRQGQVWRLVTCAFCHDRSGIFHILFNMLFLFWFGVTLESMYGSLEFLYYYLTAAVVSSLAYVGLDLITGDNIPAIGASGAVMAVTMLYAIHFPRHRIYLFFVLPIEVRWLVFLYVIFDLHPLLLQLAGDNDFTGVAHAAHLGGLAFGYLYWRNGIRLQPMYDRVRLPIRHWLRGSKIRRSGLRVYNPPPGPRPPRVDRSFDARLDQILTKIHEQGQDSLTDQERQFLDQASRRYRSPED